MEINTDEINAAREAGFTDQEIKNSFADELNAAKAAGFTDQEINKQFNFQPVDDGLFKNLFDTAKKRVEERRATREAIKTEVVGEEFDGDYILEQIFGANLYNLQYRAAKGVGTPEALKMPQPKDYTWTEEFLTTLGTLGLELPIYGVSAIPGAFGGSLLGPKGTIAGAAFTGAAIPATTRSTLIEVLKNQDEQKPSDVMKILYEKSLKEGAKEGLKFSVSMLLPQAKVPGIGTLAENYFTRTAAQVIGYEGTGVLLDRELPNAREFSLSSALFALFNIRLPSKIARDKTETTYVETGKKPTDIAMDAMKDRTIIEDVGSKNIKIPRAYENIRDKEFTDLKPTEVKPGKIEIFDDPVANKAAENISFEAKSVPLTLEQTKKAAQESKRQFVIKMIDEKYPVLEALREAGVNTKTGIEKLNIYESLRLLEGMQGRSAHFVEYATLDFKTLSEKGKSLVAVVEPFSKDPKKLKLASTYLINKFAIDLAARGKETGVDIPNAKIFIKKYAKDFEKFSEEFNKYNKEMLEYARDGGLITQEQFNAFTTINKNYASMARRLPKEGEVGFTKGSSNPFRKLKGSKLEIIDPIESALKNTDFIIRATEKNKVSVDFIEFVEKMKEVDPKIFDYVKKKTGIKRPIEVQRKELEQFFDKKDIQKFSDNTVESFTIFRQEYIYPDKSSIGIRRNGKYEVWEVGEDLATAFKSTDIQGMKLWQKWLSAPARTLRTGAIVTPDFALPNFFRDTMNATFLSKVGWVPIVDSMIGTFHIIYKDPKRATEAYKRYLKGGGSQSTIRSIDKNLFDKNVHEILNNGIMRNEYNWKNPLAPFRYLTDASEIMTRVQMSEKVYKAAKKKGLTEREALERAGFESRDLLDYQKKGTFGATVNRYSAFWNARVQGSTKLYEAFRDRPQRAFAMVGLTVALPTLGFLYLNYDFEKGKFKDDYLELPEYIKQNKWYFNVDGVKGFFPKGYEIGTFFAGIIEKTAIWIAEDDPKGFKEFLYDFGMSNIKSFNPIPTWLRPHLENAMNYSFFRDAPILPADAPKDMLNQYYSTEYNNQAIKKLAENLTLIVGADNYFANPIYLENIYDSYTGGIGRIVKQSIEDIAISAGVIDDPIRPEDPLTKIPGIRAFQAKDIYNNSASIAKFYDETKKYEKVFNTVEYLTKSNDTNALKKLYKEYNFDVAAVVEVKKFLNEVDNDIKVIYNAKKKNDGTLWTSKEKQEQIEDLYKVKIGFAQKGLQIIKNVEKEQDKIKQNKQ